MSKKISIIVPCYNIEQYIERFFASIEAQTMPIDDMEVILVDDQSKDHTWEHICAFEQKYPEHVIAIQNDVNSKQGFSRNSAMRYASGEYIAFLDGDDWIEPNYMLAMYEKAVQYDCDMVTCNAWRDFGDGNRIEIAKSELAVSRLLEIDSIDKRKPLIVNETFGVTAWAKLIHRTFCVEHELFFPENMVFEDIAWGSLLYLYVERVYIMSDYLYHYFINRNSVVLKKGQDYYRDMFMSSYYKYEQIEARNMFSILHDELEFDFIVNYYLASLKMFGNHYDSIPVEAFEELQQFILEHFPNYKQNPYFKINLDEKNQMQLYFIDKKMSEVELKQLHQILSGRV